VPEREVDDAVGCLCRGVQSVEVVEVATDDAPLAEVMRATLTDLAGLTTR
jgi:hypothetical protein